MNSFQVTEENEQAGSKTVKTVEKSAEKTVKQSVTSAGKKTVKTVGKGAVKTTGKTVKTAERTAKTAIKTSQQAAKTAQKAAQASAKAARAAAQAARAAAKAAVVAAKWIAKATVAVVKAIIAAVKGLVAAIAAGGWVAVVIIIVICLIALILCSVFGIFFSGEDSGTGQTMQTAVQEINTEYDNNAVILLFSKHCIFAYKIKSNYSSAAKPILLGGRSGSSFFTAIRIKLSCDTCWISWVSLPFMYP